jgi:hypothetical protein
VFPAFYAGSFSSTRQPLVGPYLRGRKMAKFEIAHLSEQNQDIVVVVVDNSFGRKPEQEQYDITQALQACAASARLRGTVVPVWDAGGGRMGFLAPKPWHPFFEGLTLADVAVNVTGTLTCD